MTRKRRATALALGSLILLTGGTAGLTDTESAWATEGALESLAAPEASLESGRYIGAQTVSLSAPAGAEIRYTLDGTAPTRASALYSAPIRIDTSANLTAVAFSDGAQSAPVMRGILIKTAEEPAAQFAVMSDIHLSSKTPASDGKWQQYFDTLASIVPNPDAIVSNGDQINDNYFNSASDHQYPRAMLQENLSRTGMAETDVLMTFGNHDDRVERMAEQYPDEWFPSTKGYYETTIGGFPAFMVNTEAWGAEQAGWLYDRLTALSADPATSAQPIFVFGHRPLPNTVWDGAQASNSGLKTNLSDFPQVMYFSGHSHLNITDERSIHQDSFTSVNEGSMSYEETDSAFQAFGNGLAKEHTIPTAQSVIVEVYGDRVEIDRINYAADHGRTYTDDGVWSFQENPPFSSTGTLAGPSWVVGRGATPAETKAKFSYTQANRNAQGPVWGAAEPEVELTPEGLMLNLPQASDDQYVKDYTLEITDVETGERVNLLPAGARLSADYVFSPRAAELRVPLQVRKDNKVGQPIDRALTLGKEYAATLVAYDSYRNASEPRSFTFVAAAIDRTALEAVSADAAPVLERLDRVLGDAAAAQQQDFGFYVADPEAARAAAAQLRATLGAKYATQPKLDAAVTAAETELAELGAQLVAVDRAVLTAAIADTAKAVTEAENTLAGAEAEAAKAEVGRAAAAATGEAATAAKALIAARDAAVTLAATLNQSQVAIDTAAAALTDAATAYADAKPGPGTGGTGGADGAGGAGEKQPVKPAKSGGDLAETGGSTATVWGLAAAATALIAAAGVALRRARGRAERG